MVRKWKNKKVLLVGVGQHAKVVSSMIIDDNSLTKLNVEENPGEVAASSAETIIGQL